MRIFEMIEARAHAGRYHHSTYSCTMPQQHRVGDANGCENSCCSFSRVLRFKLRHHDAGPRSKQARIARTGILLRGCLRPQRVAIPLYQHSLPPIPLSILTASPKSLTWSRRVSSPSFSPRCHGHALPQHPLTTAVVMNPVWEPWHARLRHAARSALGCFRMEAMPSMPW